LDQKRTFSEVCVMSALPPKAEIGCGRWDVRFCDPQVLSHTFKS